MSKIVQKLSNVPKTLYEHKKKTIFFSFVGYLGADWVYRWNRNMNIRKEYARQAVVFGEQIMPFGEKPKRIFVLVNVEGNQRNCFDAFSKNALPLFHLAGIKVDVVKADNESQLEALAGAVDKEEADILYVVGGDGTIGKVVTGILRNRDSAVLPMGFYPGGYDNLWLKRMVPSVFESTGDVRAACESAMAVIEDRKRDVYAFEVQREDSNEKPEYGIGDVSAGWFRQIEDTRKKLWYFSVFKRRWAYIWEMIKRSPQSIECSIEIEEPCSGCEKCRPKIIVKAPEWRWWHVLTGTPKYKNTDVQRDFSGVVNEKCGTKTEIVASGTEIIVNNEQKEDYSQLNLRIGGNNFNRFDVISEGWKRCSNDIVGRSTSEGFYSVDVMGKSVTMKISKIPDYIHRLYLSSVPSAKDAVIAEKKVEIRGTLKKLQVFLPEMIRVNLEDV